MGRSIAATVLANAKKQEAEDLKNAKRREEEKRKKAERQHKQDPKNAKSVIISAVQEDMDNWQKCLREWKAGDEVEYDFSKSVRLLPSEIVEVAQSLGFTCEYQNKLFWISIPMWKKGEKKTPAQLMLYHHQMALRKWIKELKAEAWVVAKRDCKEVLERLEKRDYDTRYNSQRYAITVPIVTEGLRMAFYDEQVRSIMKARGFKEVILMRNAWQIIFPKNK